MYRSSIHIGSAFRYENGVGVLPPLKAGSAFDAFATTAERLRLLYDEAGRLERTAGAWGGALVRVRMPARRYEEGAA